MYVFEDITRRIKSWCRGPRKKDVVAAMDRVIARYQGVLDSTWVLDGGIHVVRNQCCIQNAADYVYVCVHGTGSSSVSFMPFLETLDARGIPGLAIDLPGYGISEGFTDTRYIDECTRKLHQALGELGLGGHRILWVGHSLGAVVAAWAAMRDPQNAYRVCMLSPPGLFPFRWNFWTWLIRHGVPEYYLTTPYISWIAWPISWLVRNHPLYVYMWMFWCNQDRTDSYKFLASCLNKKRSVDAWNLEASVDAWKYPYLQALAETLGFRTHIIWSRTDPILASPFSVCVQDVEDPWYPSISHNVVAGVGHNPIDDPVAVEILISLAPHRA